MASHDCHAGRDPPATSLAMLEGRSSSPWPSLSAMSHLDKCGFPAYQTRVSEVPLICNKTP